MQHHFTDLELAVMVFCSAGVALNSLAQYFRPREGTGGFDLGSDIYQCWALGLQEFRMCLCVCVCVFCASFLLYG